MKKRAIIITASVIILPVLLFIVWQFYPPDMNIRAKLTADKTELILEPNFRANAIYMFEIYAGGKLIYSSKNLKRHPFNEPVELVLPARYEQLKIFADIQYDYGIVACITTKEYLIQLK